MSVDTFLAEYEQHTEPYYPDTPEVNTRIRDGVEFDLCLKNDNDGDPYLYLAFIGTHERGKGHGSAALTWLCDLADRHGVTIAGHADSKTRTLRDMLAKRRTPALGKAQLREWYERHGFVFQLSDGTPTAKFFYRSPRLNLAVTPGNAATNVDRNPAV
jgi:GNAT superfamily N-acetyltransferase